MNDWSQIEGNWEQYKTTVLQQWDKLGEQELTAIGGDRTRLTRKLQEVYNLSEDEAERQVAQWEGNFWTGA